MEPSFITGDNDLPASTMDGWEEDLLRRYPEGADSQQAGAFRNYEADARPCVREFYRLNHHKQTLQFAREKKADYLQFNRRRMTVWQALEFLNELVDDSDPDIDLPQIEHLLQTAEAIRADGHPRWFILVGLIHDLGKILCLFGEEQWAVVGDTFPLGCRFSEKVVFHEFFSGNPDREVSEYSTANGIYPEGCGLDQVTMSWGHDEYLYHAVKDRLPEPALYMIRYHSFYAAHREGEYGHLMNDRDREMFSWVRAFNPYDLYTKSEQRMDVAALRPFYEELINEYLPGEMAW
ncbi:MAG: inositol oxygenase [Verrucomicrobiaceae bacterium]|nr:inositol oxygenase [Verrucomicrobiaceae bacterium]